MASVNIDRESMSGDFTFDYKDTITRRYKCDFNSDVENEYDALIAAQNLGLPLRRQKYHPFVNLYCLNIKMSVSAERLSFWYADVTFGPPPDGEGEEQQNENPLLRPPVYNIEYQEQEYVIEQAKNVNALSHGNGAGGNRAANTLGPIVNAAGKRPDEPIVDTERNAVLIIQRNFPSLAAIIDLNETYQRTTNNSSISLGSGTVSARRLRYLLTDTPGKEIENEIEFWPGTTRIEVRKTTDLILDNVGYDYWDAATSKIKEWRVDGERPGEPINLKLDGTEGGDNTTTITYRHLEEVGYDPLVS